MALIYQISGMSVSSLFGSPGLSGFWHPVTLPPYGVDGWVNAKPQFKKKKIRMEKKKEKWKAAHCILEEIFAVCWFVVTFLIM